MNFIKDYKGLPSLDKLKDIFREDPIDDLDYLRDLGINPDLLKGIDFDDKS